MSGIKLEKAGFALGERQIFEDINLEMEPSEITVILGPSGCGKTSLLRCIAGLSELSEGRLLNPYEQSMSFVFQEPRLLPWRSVFDNLDINIRAHIEDRRQREVIIDKILEKTGLYDKRKSLPHELSGGMKFRLSLARAFSRDYQLLLLDEPMQGQDIKTRQTLLHLVKEIRKDLKTTTIYVTHDTREAVLLGQRIVIMSSAPGRIMRVIDNPAAAEKISLEDARALELEKELYSLMIYAT